MKEMKIIEFQLEAGDRVEELAFNAYRKIKNKEAHKVIFTINGVTFQVEKS